MEVFHMPGLHPGMFYLPPRPGWVLRPAEGASVRMFAESDVPELREMQQSAIRRQKRRGLVGVMEVNSAPVLLENARFRNSFGTIDGRIWLNGAAGERMRNKFDQSNPQEWQLGRLYSAFRRARNEAALPLPVYKSPVDHLPVAIELKNGFNYYHFTTETLGSLAHFVDDDSDQPINLHLPQDNLRDFMRKFVEEIFPTLADRVAFVSAARHYPQVRSVYSHRHYLYQVEDARLRAVVAGQEMDPRWNTLRPEPPYCKRIAMASFDSSLRMLREQALRRVPRKLVEQLPRLVWMGRDEGGAARLRGLTGQARLMAGLGERGFHCVAFEHLSPLEQIAQMQAADILVAPHGAGLANMTYAKPGALVIEIGTRQTQMHRWGDFLPCAHVSRCRYDTVFADIAGVSRAGEVPPMSEGHMGIHIGKRATRRVLALVDEALGTLPAGPQPPDPSISRNS